MHFVNRDRDWFTACLKDQDLITKLKQIKLVISDIDGCLTDGKVYYSGNDHIQKSFSIQDGFMMAKCNKASMPHVALISGRSDAAATKRAKVLGIPDDLYYQGVDSNKSDAVKKVQERVSVSKKETLFFGDDLLDLEAKESVGLFAAPTNGLFYVQSNADIILPRSGGNGAFRLLLDLILYVQDKHIAHDTIKTALE